MKSPLALIIPVAIGFFLSFFTGLISGASFGILLLRALISGVVFGGAAAAVRFIAGRFLLSGERSETAAASGNGESGAKVDITLDEEVFTPEELAGDAYFNPVAQAADSFTPVPLAEEKSAGGTNSVPVFDKENFDPAVLAEAIRTVMSKDG